MATSDTMADDEGEPERAGVPNLLSTAAMTGGADGRDDALRQGEAAHVGAELAAAEQGERQGRALHGLQPVGRCRRPTMQTSATTKLPPASSATPQPDRQHRRAEHGRAHDRVAVAEQQLEQARC